MDLALVEFSRGWRMGNKQINMQTSFQTRVSAAKKRIMVVADLSEE